MADCDCGLCAQCNGQAIKQAVVWRTEAPPEAGWRHCVFVDVAGRPFCVPAFVREGGHTVKGRPVLYGPPIEAPEGWRSALLALEGVSYG